MGHQTPRQHTQPAARACNLVVAASGRRADNISVILVQMTDNDARRPA
jgi:hypothetical protein